MPKNRELLAVLKDTAKLRGPTVVEAERNSALDELLKSDINNPQEFRSAVLSQESLTFWQKMDNSIAPPGWDLGSIKRGVRALVWVSARPVQNDDFLSTKPSEGPSFKEIKQAAAEQRVKFSLAAAQNDVLVGLLTSDFTDNGTILRQYLASRENSLGLKFGEIHGWNPSNEDVLTHASLAKIRIEAANQLLLKLIAKPELTDPKLFDDLTKATNIGEFQTAAKALITAGGITLPPGKTLDDITNGLAFDSVAVVVDAATKRRDNLLDLKAIAEFENQLQIFKSSATSPDLLGMKNTLKKGPKPFIDALAADAKLKEDPQHPYKNRMTTLEDSQRTNLGTKHQQPLCEQYLKAKILAVDKAINDANLLNALKEASKANLKTQLETFVVADADDKTIIGMAVTDSNLAAFKVALTANIIKKIGSGGQPGDLKALKELEAASVNLESFRKELVKKVGNGVAFEFVEENDLPELRKALRDQIGVITRKEREKKFETEVEKYSRLGSKAHPTLIDVFKQLPETKQAEIMKPGKEHELLFVINAKSAEEIKYYWGTKDAKGNNLDLTGLVQENERAAAFKQIMNPTIAKVLMGLPTVTPAMVGAINTALLAQKDNIFSNPGDYKNFIDALHNACGAPAAPFNGTAASTGFYKAFNLIDYNDGNLIDASANATPTTVSEKIQDEHKKNKLLFEAHKTASGMVNTGSGSQVQQALSATEKKFVEIIARVAPQQANLLSIDDQVNPISLEIKRLYQQTFASSTNVHQFLDKLIPEDQANRDPAKRTLKNELSKEFTPSVYNELKGMRVKSLFNQGARDQLYLINEITTDLERLQKDKPAIKKHKGHLEALEKNLNALPALYSGANEVKAKNKAEKMLEEYKALEKQCDTVIVHLEHVRAELKVRLDNTPSGALPAGDVKDQFNLLHKELNKEIIEIEDQLKFYKKIKQKISGENGALEQIKGIQNRKLTAVIETTSTSYTELDLADIQKIDDDRVFPIKPGARNSNLTSAVTNTNDSPTLLKIPDQGKILGINTFYGTKTDPNNPGQQIDIKGRIAINYHPEDALPPKSSLVGKDVVSSRPIKVMIAVPVEDPVHRADQSLRAAKELLKDWDGESLIKLKGWQGKEKELAYLWTAICVLGEHHPKFSRDKISVTGTANWKPDGERNWRGFKAESVYNKVFMERASGTTAEHVREFTAIIAPKKREEVDKGVKKSTSFYRDTLTDTKEHNIETEVNKDLAVEGKAKTLGG
ncbi:interaptin [Legionella sp. WA2024007413]